MSDQEQTGGVAPAQPQRLIFDRDLADDDIPQFLRKKTNVIDEPEDTPVTQPITQKIDRPSVFIPIIEDNESVASIEHIAETAVPAETENPSELETKETTVEHFSDDEPGKRGDSVVIDPALEATLEEVSFEELQRQQEEINRKIQAKRLAEKRAAIDQIKHVVATYEIPLEELVEALGGLKVKRKGVKAVQKYRDPKTGATWSGRGKEPAWIRGKKRDKFLIQN